MIYAGIKSLEMYQPTNKQWMQAHSQARFSILRSLINAGEGLVHIEETLGSDGKADLLITLDRSKIDTVGRKAIENYLLRIQIFKSTADLKSASEMFGKLTAVDNDGQYPWAQWRDIIMDRKQPRKFFVQHNTIAEGSTVTLKSYDASLEGLIQSWIERFPDNAIYKALDYNWIKDKQHYC
jgi:dipeptidyl-peptidase-3